MKRVLLLLCAFALLLAACATQPKPETTTESTTQIVIVTTTETTTATEATTTTEKPITSEKPSTTTAIPAATEKPSTTKSGNSDPAWAYYNIYAAAQNRVDYELDLQCIVLDLAECKLKNKKPLVDLVQKDCDRRGLTLLVQPVGQLGSGGVATTMGYKFRDDNLTAKELKTRLTYYRGGMAYNDDDVSAVLVDGEWQVEFARDEPRVVYKPVIYLYPKTPTQVDVSLTLRSSVFTKTIPPYNTGWHVLAQPGGTLTNLADGQTYPYLFWEAMERDPWPEATEGFLVHREDLAGFFREKLAYMGLIPAEYEEFIAFWLPMLQENEHNLIYFAGKEYTARYPLQITPAPDSTLRVFMIARPATGREKIAPQTLKPFTRKGFTVIEWGGTLLG